MDPLKYTADGEYIFTVQELNLSAKQLLEKHFQSVWIKGELSNVSKPASGHYYFTLKDAGSQIKCAFFRPAQVKQGSFSAPEEGKSMLIRGKVTLYAERGEYQLLVEEILDIGTGLLQQQFEFLKAKLSKAGLFEPSHKKPLPPWIQTLGVITSQTGAALQDICAVLKRRAPFIQVIVYHSAVQGEEAPHQLRAALYTAIQENRADALLFTRGGGALEDLFAFNDEALIHEIFKCPIPTISAVGHEIDFTLCDFVADLRAPTPSAAAEMLSQSQEVWLNFLTKTDRDLLFRVESHLFKYKERLNAFKNRLKHPRELLTQKRTKLLYLTEIIHKNIHNIILKKSSKHMEIKNTFHSLSPEKMVSVHKQKLAELIAKVDTLSPLKTLQRGYTIATKLSTGEILTDPEKASAGEKIQLQLAKGRLNCIVCPD
jgi:exodeoxyribonuclease VII large subunit